MNLVSAVAQLFSAFEFLDDIGVSRGRHERRKPVQPRDDTVFNLAGWHVTRPANDHRYAEAAFQCCPLASCERGLTSVRPSEILGAIVGAERQNRIVR